MTTLTSDPISQAQQRLTTATATFDTASAALYQADGKPIYAPDVLEQQLTTLRETLQSEATVVEQLLTTERESLERSITQLSGGDLADLLTPEELARANARASFVSEDAQQLALADLLARVNAVALGSDRALAFLWHRYASARVQAALRDQKAVRTRPDSAALAALTPLLRSIAEQIEGPERKQQRERAHVRLKQVDQARSQLFRERSTRLQPPARRRSIL